MNRSEIIDVTKIAESERKVRSSEAQERADALARVRREAGIDGALSADYEYDSQVVHGSHSIEQLSANVAAHEARQRERQGLRDGAVIPLAGVADADE